MRVAKYSQPSEVTRGSFAAICILAGTVLLGTSAVLELLQYFAPPLSGLATPFWLLLYLGAGMGLMFGQGINWISWLVRYRILLVILLIGTMASVSWAVDQRLSFERTVHLTGSTLLAIYIGFTLPLLTILRVLGVVLGGILLASLVAAVVLPDLGVSEYEGSLVWSGILSSKNALGFWAAAGVLLYVALSDSTRSFWLRLLCYLMAAISLALLVFSHSATSLLAMVVAGALSFYLYVANRFRLGFVQMTVLAVLMVALVVLAAANIDTAELIGRSGDLTGRGEVWRQTWKLIMDRPATGYGYGTLWFPNGESNWIQERYTDFTWTVYHAHNGFLQVASEIGLPLAVIALLMVAQQLIEIFYCQYSRQQVGVLFVLAYTVAYLIGNYSEARFLVNRELYWILFIALPISMLRQINVVTESETGSREESDPEAGEGFSLRDRVFNDGRGGPVPAYGMPAGAAAGHGYPRLADARPFGAAAGTATAHGTGRHVVGEWQESVADDDDDGSEWTEEDFDATIDALTLADADIDLGISSVPFHPAGRSARAPLPPVFDDDPDDTFDPAQEAAVGMRLDADLDEDFDATIYALDGNFDADEAKIDADGGPGDVVGASAEGSVAGPITIATPIATPIDAPVVASPAADDDDDMDFDDPYDLSDLTLELESLDFDDLRPRSGDDTGAAAGDESSTERGAQAPRR